MIIINNTGINSVFNTSDRIYSANLEIEFAIVNKIKLFYSTFTFLLFLSCS